jgi:steroid delta-isomerase-like uncharacterized protein
MKAMLFSVSMAILVCLSLGCQDKAAVAELERYKAQAEAEEQNEALALKMMEVWGRGDLVAYKEFLSADFLFYYPSNSPNPMSVDGLSEFAETYWRAITDISWSREEVVAKDDRVIIRFTEKGTQIGEFMGIPATGNRYEVSGIMILRIRNGKCVEMREDFDMLGLYQQLGMELKPKEETAKLP